MRPPEHSLISDDPNIHSSPMSGCATRPPIFALMGIDLSDRQRAEPRDQGKITGAAGRGDARRGTKAKRGVADDLVASGAPLVLEMYSSGQFEWFDGEAATRKWAEVRPYVISTQPTSKQLGKHEMWNAGVWEDEEGSQLLHLTGSCCSLQLLSRRH
jgi:hypothetical protein